MTLPCKKSSHYKILTLIIIFLFFSIFQTGCTSGGDGGGGEVGNTATVTGLIFNSQTGEHIANVVVRIGEIQGDSDSEGQYRLTNVPTGSQTIAATKEGYQEYSSSVQVDEGQVNFKDIEMTASVPSGSILGMVIDKDTGSPIENAKVSIDSHTTYSDSWGTFLITGVSSGYHTLIADKQGFEEYTDTLDVKAGKAIFLEINLKHQSSTGSVKGKVTDADSGAFLSGVSVVIGSVSTFSDHNGLYRLTGIPAGTQTVTAARSGYSYYSASVEVSANETVFHDISMSPLSEKGAIAGFVIDKDSMHALEDVIITVGSFETYTDSEGKYIVTGISSGEYTITAQKAGYENYSSSINISAGEVTENNIEMTKKSNIGTVRGIVTDASSGHKIENALVYIGSIDTRTNHEGIYQLTGVGAGQRTIVAQKTGYEFYTGSVDVINDQVVSHNIELTPNPATGSVRGIVTDSDFGYALDNVLVTIGSAETKSDEDGHYQLTGVNAGSRTIHAQLSGYENYSGTVDVKAGELVSHDIVMKPLSTIGAVEGVVTDEETGDEIEKAWIIVGFQFTRTDRHGYYDISGIKAGSHKIYALKHAYFIYSGNVDIKAGETVSHDIKMKPFTIKGTVTGVVTDSQTGATLEDVTVLIGLNETKTDSDGRYKLTGAVFGPRFIFADKSGYKFYVGTVNVKAGETVIRDIKMDPKISRGNVQGTVTDSVSGDLIESVNIVVGSSDTKTDKQGNYSLTGIKAGNRLLSAKKCGYEYYTANISIAAGQTTDYDFSMTPVSTTGTVSGMVTDADSGDPLEDVRVKIRSVETFTDADGNYKLTGVKEGTSTITAKKTGYFNSSDRVDVNAGEEVTKNIQMTRKHTNGAVEGVVTDTSGNAVKDVLVFIGDTEVKTGGNGSFKLNGIDEGNQTIHAVKSGYQDYSASVSVVAGQTTEHDIEMEPDDG